MSNSSISKPNILDILSMFNIQVCRGNKIICPFHNDTHPSMQIYPDTNSFYCWSCQNAGDSISLYAKLKGISNKEAFKEFAKGNAKPTRHQQWEMNQQQLFKEEMAKKRKKINENFMSSRRAVASAAEQITDMNDPPDEFWALVGIHARDEIRMEISDTSNDADLWRWCKKWAMS